MNTINQKLSVENYPYGRLRTTAYFSVEFNAKKGFRHVFQTINPKNGQLNKPKYSTYSHLAYLNQNEEGFITQNSFTVWGYEDVKKVIQFLLDNPNIDIHGSYNNQLEFVNILCACCIRANYPYTMQNLDSEDKKEAFKILAQDIYKELVKNVNSITIPSKEIIEKLNQLIKY